jgi:SET family sugar efflux transporter-like MFS transporter
MPNFRMPVTALLSASLFMTGISAAATAPYRAIVAVEGLGMSNGSYALVMTLSSIGSAIASLLLGFFADRISDRRLLVIACATLGGLAYGLIYLFPTVMTYVLVFCVIMPFGAALFSQTFSYSRAYYDRRFPERSEFIMSVLRTVFALAWVVVPPVAGWIASAYTVFDVFAVAALAHVGCTLVFGLLLTDPEAHMGTGAKKQQVVADAGSWKIPADRLLGIGGVTLIRVAMMLHLTVLPLALTHDFGGTLTDVGINAGIAAALEVPFMLGWGFVAMRFSKDTIIVVNAVIYAVYLLLVFHARTVADVFWLQGLNAIATAALLSLTISYMQETIKGRVGLSTSLMDVVTVTSALIAAAAFAALSTQGSYIMLFLAGGVLSLVGGIIIAVSRLMRRRVGDDAVVAGQV